MRSSTKLIILFCLATRGLGVIQDHRYDRKLDSVSFYLLCIFTFTPYGYFLIRFGVLYKASCCLFHFSAKGGGLDLGVGRNAVWFHHNIRIEYHCVFYGYYYMVSLSENNSSRVGNIGVLIYNKNSNFDGWRIGCHYTAQNKNFLLKKLFSSYHTAIAQLGPKWLWPLYKWKKKLFGL